LGEVGLKILTQLINNIYESEMWDRNFTAVITISLSENPIVAKCRDHPMVSIIANTAQVVAMIVRIRLERETE
jgi:hypothetical protein